MVNYDKSTIYKLCCKDPSISDIYIGSTTNFTRRKGQHKSVCNNSQAKHHHLKVYQLQLIPIDLELLIILNLTGITLKFINLLEILVDGKIGQW